MTWRGKEILVPYLLDSVPRSTAGKESRAAGAGWLAALQCKPSRNPPFTPSSWQVPWQVEAFLKILPVTLPSNPGIEMPSAWGVGEAEAELSPALELRGLAQLCGEHHVRSPSCWVRLRVRCQPAPTLEGWAAAALVLSLPFLLLFLEALKGPQGICYLELLEIKQFHSNLGLQCLVLDHQRSL